MNNFNIDENTLNKLKGMLNNGDLSDITSKIPADVLKNFSSKMQSGNSNSNNINLNNIDINTIMKMQKIIDKINSGNSAGNNLLNSLRPYLREGKKEKLDQYANLMNFAQIAELLNSENNKENKK